MNEIIRRIVAVEKNGIAAMESELVKAIEEQNTNYEFLVVIMDELMNRSGELWCEEEKENLPKEITGAYLYLMDRVAEYAKRNLGAEGYHRFCREVDFMLF